MRLGWIIGALAALGAAGCTDRMGEYPALMPTDRLLAPPAIPAHAAGSAADPEATRAGLAGRGAALAARARALGAQPSAPASPGEVAPGATGDPSLARRAEALRTRARALAEQPLDQAPPAPEAAGGGAAAPCPEGDPACGAPPAR